MTPVADRSVDPDAAFAQHEIMLGANDIAISQSDILQDAHKPGFPFEIVRVEHFTDAIAATATYMVKIGTTDALAAETAPTADTLGEATLTTTLANRKGSATDVINLHATTDGSGTFTDLRVRVIYKRQRDAIPA
jgi:hypothetical protein